MVLSIEPKHTSLNRIKQEKKTTMAEKKSLSVIPVQIFADRVSRILL